MSSSELKALTTQVSYNGTAVKAAYHRAAKKLLKTLADALGLTPGEYDLRSNAGGIAVSGEVTLHTDKLYVQVSQSSMGPNADVLYRACNGRKDYGGLTNHFASVLDLADTDKMLARIAMVYVEAGRYDDAAALHAKGGAFQTRP